MLYESCIYQVVTLVRFIIPSISVHFNSSPFQASCVLCLTDTLTYECRHTHYLAIKCSLISGGL